MLFFWWDDMNGPDMQQFSVKHQREREVSLPTYSSGPERERESVCVFL